MGFLHRHLHALTKVIKYKKDGMGNFLHLLSGLIWLRNLIQYFTAIGLTQKDVTDVEQDYRLLKEEATKILPQIKTRLDWQELFVEMFTELPETAPENKMLII